MKRLPNKIDQQAVIQKQSGFTIVELMIATSVFSVFLLIVSLLVLQISRTYTKGLISSKTQEAARSISSELARAIQFGGDTLSLPTAFPTPGTTYTFCAGSLRYTFVTGLQQKSSPSAGDQAAHVLVGDSVPLGCPSGSLSGFDNTTQRELMGENMRLSNLSISQIGTGNLYSVKVRVAYGDEEALEGSSTSPTVLCKNQQSTSHFCAVSELTTIVEKRL